MTTRERMSAYIEDLLFLDPPVFDEAILGLAQRAGGTVCVAYDRARCIDILARDMSREEAEEYFEFNTASAWVGEATPVFIDTRWAE